MNDDQPGPEAFGRSVARFARLHGARRVLIDMSGVTYVSSRGLGKLVALLKQLQPDGEVALFGLRANVCEVFATTHLDRLFPIRPAADFPLNLDPPAGAEPTAITIDGETTIVLAPSGMVF